jgi:hypothetical protein
MPRTPRAQNGSARVSFDTVRTFGATLPGVYESTSYGTAALKVGRTLFARLKEDGRTLVLKMDMVSRDFLIQAQPDVFFITDHYRNYTWILIRLDRIERRQLLELVEDAWRRAASRRLIQMHEAGLDGRPRADK